MRVSTVLPLLGGALMLSACQELTSPAADRAVLALSSARHRFFVTPAGSATGDGSASRPWDLRTALAHPAAVQPGDTIWLRAGTYTGAFTSSLRGTASAPIVVRRYPGERATIRGTLAVGGAYTWYWGFEVANTNTSTQNVMGINSHAPGSRFINLVVHDHSGNGIGVWSEAPDAEVYGCVMYNNGFRGSSAGRAAHGVYAQNSTGWKRLRENLVFQTFGYGFHLYTEGSALRNFTLEGNVAFNNGLLDGNEVMIGGGTPVQQLTFRANMTYHNPELSGGGVWLGRAGTTNSDGVVRDNYLVLGDPSIRLFNWSTLSVSNNTVVAGKALLNAQGSWGQFAWSGNHWYGTPTRQEILWGTTGMTYSVWKQLTRLGSSDTYGSGNPGTAKVFVRPNAYERGRATVVVYNWARQAATPVNLGSVLSIGDRYEIRSALAPYGSPLASGTYGGGTISFPLPAAAPPRPIVGWPVRAPAATNAFNVFLVTRAGS
jgi:hypothetical protein